MTCGLFAATPLLSCVHFDIEIIAKAFIDRPNDELLIHDAAMYSTIDADVDDVTIESSFVSQRPERAINISIRQSAPVFKSQRQLFEKHIHRYTRVLTRVL